MNPIGIIQVTDTLMIGGLERMAVNIANHLPPNQFDSHFCATRRGGSLRSSLRMHVHCLQLERKSRFDVKALIRFASYLRHHHIKILHAHGSSLFLAVLASLFPPFPIVLWHDHFGRNANEQRPVWLYRTFARRIQGTIAVTQSLAQWSRHQLHVPPQRVWYIPNFVGQPEVSALSTPLPGESGGRIVCVANLRSQKDHLTLLRAMNQVIQQYSKAHLILIGGAGEPACSSQLFSEINKGNLAGRVSWLGTRDDVFAVLQNCDIGVLSSRSEGLPLALLEYGMAGLPAVATKVGECAEVLGEGAYGLLVPPGEPRLLAEALLNYLKSPSQRIESGRKFYDHILRTYSASAIMNRICSVYQTLLANTP
jgi:glycosyltransferase involved in cell wall biosynthesis